MTPIFPRPRRGLTGHLAAATLLLCAALPVAAPASAYTVAGCNTTAGPPVIGQQRLDRDESTDGRPANCSVAFNGAAGFGESSTTPGVLRNAASTSFTAGSYGFARARGSWGDRITIVGPTFLSGRPGRVYFNWGVDGRLETTGDGSAIAFARLMAGPLNQGLRILDQASHRLSTPGDVSIEDGGRGVELFFVYDQPFEVLFEVDVTAQSPQNFPVNGSLIGGSASARFGSTAWWGGITRVEDEFGNALDIQVVTDSGLNLMNSLKPATPVPEPATGALMLSGLGALAWALRRRQRALLLALACAAGSAHAQQLRVEGYTCAGECDTYAQQSSVLPLSALSVKAYGGSDARSAAQADFGVLRLLASSSGFASSQTTVSFADRLTVLPASAPWTGMFGLLEWRMALSGMGDLQIIAADGYGSVGIDTFAPGASPGTGRSQSFWFNAIGGPVQFEGDALPRDIVVRQGFVFGEPFDIGFQLNATTGAAGAVAQADLMNTATWGGITSVSVAGVALDVDAFRLQSASGTDYLNAITPVPELPAALLWVLGLGVLRMCHRGNAAGRRERNLQ